MEMQKVFITPTIPIMNITLNIIIESENRGNNTVTTTTTFKERR